MTMFDQVGFSEQARELATADYDRRRTFADRQTSSISRMLDDLAVVYDECRVPDWDGRGGQPVSRDTMRTACDVVESLPEAFPRPAFNATPRGGIDMEWYTSPRWLYSIHVVSPDSLCFSGIFGRLALHGSTPWVGRLPEEMLTDARNASNR